MPGPRATADFDACTRAITTTDQVSKLHTRTCAEAVFGGVAEGVGLIEPTMATLLTFFFTEFAAGCALWRPIHSDRRDRDEGLGD